MRRFFIMAICCIVVGCADSVDEAARRAYELTLPAPADGFAWSIRRNPASKVATWQIRDARSRDEYATWVRPRLLKNFDSVVAVGEKGLLFSKALEGDRYTLEIREAEPPTAGYLAAIFTARPL